MKKVVFSGIQPTGSIHLGNYLGAIRNWVNLQNDYKNIFCIVNSHAITIAQEPKILRAQTLELAAMLLACGINPKKSALFIQSQIDYHGALAWILDCNILMGEMNRMTQFKDKSSKNPKNINVGLFNYPALMAADILLYKSDFVPVGADQKQHIELTRDVAMRFNRDFGEVFTIPEPLIFKNGARIMGLDNPNIKMSKSIKAPNHAIFLLDSPEIIDKKIKKAVTDSNPIIEFDEARAGLYNLLGIYEILSGENKQAIEAHFANKNFSALKSELSELIISTLAPIRSEYERLLGDEKFLSEILENGKNEALPIARQTYNSVKEKIGLV